MIRTSRLVALLTTLVVAAACGEGFTSPNRTAGPPAPGAAAKAGGQAALTPDLAPVARSIDGINDALAARGAEVRLARAEWVPTAQGVRADRAGGPNHVVFADDRNLRLESRWVPGDPRRDGRTALNQFVDGTFAVANGAIPVEGEIDASFETWNQVACSALRTVDLPDDGRFPSALLTLNGQPGDVAGIDIGTVGFLPGFIFDIVLGPGASTRTLGVTFTFTFIGPDGEPTDIDGDGRNDTAFKEVWYNDAFAWTADAAPGLQDVQTVALHENGHALELGHFGKVHATFNQGRGNDRPGTLHVSPRAVMNAVILGPQRELLGTDRAAFCGNFSSWPGQ
jgi:hypothetical protein